MSFFKNFLKVATGIPFGKNPVSNPLFPLQSMLGKGRGQMPAWTMPVSQEAQDYFNQQSPEDQANISAGWGRPQRTGGPWGGLQQKLQAGMGMPNPQMQQWYDAAKAAGTVPQQQTAPQQGGIGVPQGMGVAGAALASLMNSPLMSAMAPLQKVGPVPAPIDLNDEYERIKAAQGAGAAREWMKAQQR